ncbi:hypothetical protein FCH79_08260 [Pseudomonas koreensis]|nr:hypothetical protein [Pseudomonas koreensis]
MTANCRSCRRLRSFDFVLQDQKIAAFSSSYRGAVVVDTDFEMISLCRNCRQSLYAPKPFFIQDLHEHPLGASQSYLFLAPWRGLDALAASGFPTPDYR